MQVVFNADDFGRWPTINAAVALAHRQGVLTSASLMVTGEAVAEAVALAREVPTLAVGLHLVLAGGRAALPPKEISHLVDSRGHFPPDPAQAGLRYFFSRAARAELACELAAQFERFAATGLPLSHVDGHMHLHVHPTVFDLLLPLAEQYGARGIRLPRDELRPALRCDRRGAGPKIVWTMVFNLLCRRCLSRLAARRAAGGGRGLAVTHRVFGLLQTGQMREAYVVEVLRGLRVPTAEIYCHPATQETGEALGPNPADLATLLSPAVREVIVTRGLRLSTYPEIENSVR